MKNPISLNDLEISFLDKCKSLAAQGNQDSLLELLRNANYSKSESMWILSAIMEIDFKIARKIVHESNVWSDFFTIDTATNNEFMDYLDTLK